MSKLTFAIIFASLAACANSVTSEVGSHSTGDNDGCPVGQHAVWSSVPGNIGCEPIPAWPPASTGSRAVSAPCTLADGVYHVAWRTDVAEDTVPAFSVTAELEIAGNTLTLRTKDRSLEYTYSLQWVDSATVDAWEPNSFDIHEFTLNTNCSGGLTGTMTVDLPYLHPGRQMETWTLVGTP